MTKQQQIDQLMSELHAESAETESYCKALARAEKKMDKLEIIIKRQERMIWKLSM